MLLGAAIGLVPSLIEIFSKVSNHTVSHGDFWILLIAGACFVGGVVAGAFAINGQRNISNLKAKIRARAAVSMSPGNTQTPP